MSSRENGASAYDQAQKVDDRDGRVAYERGGGDEKARADPVAEADEERRADQRSVLLKNNVEVVWSISVQTTRDERDLRRDGGSYDRVVGHFHLVNDDGAEREDEHERPVELGRQSL